MEPPYLDLDYGAVDLKHESQEQHSSGTTGDGVVPVVKSKVNTAPISDENCFEIDFSSASSKPFLYNFNNSHCMSSSSLDVGVVPDGGPDAADTAAKQAVPMSAADREARVLRYREKRKNRKFEKTIRYASRKAYAETRPRIKGRFAKRNEVELEADRVSGYGVVPTY